jgi:hypothetical protein
MRRERRRARATGGRWLMAEACAQPQLLALFAIASPGFPRKMMQGAASCGAHRPLSTTCGRRQPPRRCLLAPTCGHVPFHCRAVRAAEFGLLLPHTMHHACTHARMHAS